MRSYKVVRGALDFNGVVGRRTARSRYGYVPYLTFLDPPADALAVSRNLRSHKYCFMAHILHSLPQMVSDILILIEFYRKTEPEKVPKFTTEHE